MKGDIIGMLNNLFCKHIAVGQVNKVISLNSVITLQDTIFVWQKMKPFLILTKFCSV